MHEQNTMKWKPQLIIGISLVLAPLIIAAIYILVVNIHSLYRYDQVYFNAEYRETYSSPGTVAIALEQAIRNGDAQLYSELTGLRGGKARIVQPKPSIVLSILIDVDDRDYFHYLYFDINTYLRETHYIKEVNGRWVATPPDAYFYFDSGEWTTVFAPLAAIWWAVLTVVALAIYVSRSAARTRASFGRA